MSTWKIAAGKKGGGPFETLDLRRYVEAGRLPASTFIRADDGSTDWQQLSTINWLVDSPEPCHIRHCPECDCRVLLSPQQLNSAVRCPECQAIGKLADYLSLSDPPIENVPIEPWGPYDFVMIMLAVAAVPVLCIGAFSLFFNPWFSVLLGFITLTIGAWLFAVSFHHRSLTSKYRSHWKNLDVALTWRTNRLIEVERELTGLRRSLVSVRDALVHDTENQLRKKRAEIAIELEKARDQSGAVNRMAEKFLEQAYEWWITKLRGDNFKLTKDRIQKAIDFCRKQGVDIPTEKQNETFAQIKTEYELVVRRENERDEQRRIREQLREEQRVERELKRKMESAEAEQRAIERALEAALKKADAEHSTEVARLREQLHEAQQKSERAKSQAQLTKVGHVYVISNIGSFGGDVFKVGLACPRWLCQSL